MGNPCTFGRYAAGEFGMLPHHDMRVPIADNVEQVREGAVGRYAREPIPHGRNLPRKFLGGCYLLPDLFSLFLRLVSPGTKSSEALGFNSRTKARCRSKRNLMTCGFQGLSKRDKLVPMAGGWLGGKQYPHYTS